MILPIPTQPSLIKQETTVAIVPLPKCIQYSNRLTSHLKMKKQTLNPTGLSPVSMVYLEGTKAALRKESLYSFANYQAGFEGSVTHAWIAILNAAQSSSMVLDVGMNTGFYTLLSAVIGYTVHSFELQLDCFDVSRKLLEANHVDANLYHVGIGGGGKVIEVGEGCDPGFGISQSEQGSKPQATGSWSKRKHQVGLVALDTFLDQKRQDKQVVALLKLDVEGAEIVALKGLVRHRPYVDNIILECAKKRLEKYSRLREAKMEFRQLQADGYTPYKLYSMWISDTAKWHDSAFLDSVGLREVKIHPIVKAPIEEDSTTILWEVVNWDLFFEKGPKGCNILFHRNSQHENTILD